VVFVIILFPIKILKNVQDARLIVDFFQNVRIAEDSYVLN
jgi:hypothetical protein